MRGDDSFCPPEVLRPRAFPPANEERVWVRCLIFRSCLRSLDLIHEMTSKREVRAVLWIQNQSRAPIGRNKRERKRA